MIRTPLPLDTLPRLAGENDQILDKILNLIVNGDLKLTQRDPGGCGGSGRRAALAHARPDTILQNVARLLSRIVSLLVPTGSPLFNGERLRGPAAAPMRDDTLWLEVQHARRREPLWLWQAVLQKQTDVRVRNFREEACYKNAQCAVSLRGD